MLPTSPKMSKAPHHCHTSSIHPSSNKPVFSPKKRSILTAPTTSPKPEKSRILEMHEIFLKHDRRGDNKIAITDLGDCLRTMGANPSQQMVRKHIRQLEAGTLRRISFDEVMTIYSSLGKHATRQSPRRKQTQEEQFTSSLRLYDVDNSGFLPAARLRRILTRCEDRMSEAEVDDLLVGRIDSQGMVNYGQLVHDILNG